MVGILENVLQCIRKPQRFCRKKVSDDHNSVINAI